MPLDKGKWQRHCKAPLIFIIFNDERRRSAQWPRLSQVSSPELCPMADVGTTPQPLFGWNTKAFGDG
jgi:hypothetical protein